MKTIIAITISAFLFCSGLAQIPPAPELNVKKASPYPLEQSIIDELVGKWKAGAKNIFEIKSIDPQTGAIDGTYTEIEKTDGIEFPVVGWVNALHSPPLDADGKPAKGDIIHTIVISWSARWNQRGSVTSWAGYYDRYPKALVGNWLLARPKPDYGWVIANGQDRFTKTE